MITSNENHHSRTIPPHRKEQLRILIPHSLSVLNLLGMNVPIKALANALGIPVRSTSYVPSLSISAAAKKSDEIKQAEIIEFVCSDTTQKRYGGSSKDQIGDRLMGA
ncbi:hypothetical protein RND71_008423 [Anisodus tanguticus]|uniref:Uncharacterized protein n=1 Tax=Anisodus tanguticus TaxID=243964 RepID=A0AAE1SNN3_9SOLA|nr:hypothetical protein RND71_008423 [Anisodus tanguticus]